MNTTNSLKSFIVSDKAGKLKFPKTIPNIRNKLTVWITGLLIFSCFIYTSYLNQNVILACEAINNGILMMYLVELVYRIVLNFGELFHFKARYDNIEELLVHTFYFTFWSVMMMFASAITGVYFFMDHGFIEMKNLDTFSIVIILVLLLLLKKLMKIEYVENERGNQAQSDTENVSSRQGVVNNVDGIEPSDQETPLLNSKKEMKNNDSEESAEIMKNAVHVSNEQEDEHDIFGRYIITELRILSNEYFRKKLKRKFQQALLEISVEEEQLSAIATSSTGNPASPFSSHTDISTHRPQEYAPIYSSLRFEENDGLSYSSGMAHSFFHGYLRLILPKTGGEDKNLMEIIEIYSDKNKVDVFPKLFILVPKSGICHVTLKGRNVEESRSLDEKQLTIAGVQKRVYKNSVYKIKDPKKPKEKIYVCAEYATPLRTFRLALDSSGPFSETFRKHKEDIILHFYLITRDLVRKDPEICDLCELIYYDDRDEKGDFQDVSQVLLRSVKKNGKKKH